MDQSLVILEELISRRRNNKTRRLTNLLADFSEGYARNWLFCVPIFFAEALDIHLTERIIRREKIRILTQESYFNFSPGDTFYNHPYVYCDNFKCNIGFIKKYCLQIESAIPCTPQFEDKSRNPGQINFKILEFKDNWRALRHQSLSQDDFIKLLIRGIQE